MNAPSMPGSQHEQQAFGPDHVSGNGQTTFAPAGPNPSYITGGQYGDGRHYDQHPHSYTQAHSAQTQDSGKVLGIISLVASLSTFLGFNFLGPLIGIITGYYSRKNARAAGLVDNEFGKWGFWLGIVFLGLTVLGGLIGVSVGALTGLVGLASGW